jgi:hypothetical protein
VLLSNQTHQNEKLGIDDFDEFPLLVPPLDDDPFASLSTANITAMEAALNDADRPRSKYEEEEEGEEDDEDYDEWFTSLTRAPSFPFFGALMPKGEKNLSI